MPDKTEDVKCEVACGGVGCPCVCKDCTCQPNVVKTEAALTKETAALVEEFSHRELG